MGKNVLEDTIKISNYSLDHEQEYELPENTTWIKEIISDLESDFDESDKEQLKNSYLSAHLQIKKVQNSSIGDHLTVRGHVVGNFSLPCVRCLTPTLQEIDAHFASVFINPHFEKDEEYEDCVSIFCDGEEMDLYFHDKGNINLKELIYEQVHVVADPLPLHDENCKGLCPICGVDLNHEDCGHGQAVAQDE